MEKKSLYQDLIRNPRESEDSRIVASKWNVATDAYLPEIPDASNAQYFNLAAERLLYRSKILSLPIDQALSETDALQLAHPFGINGPTFSDLRDASVRMAMAFVPLTPAGGNGKAVMARLYCVAGLSSINKPPFADGVDSPDIDKYSWFVAGVPTEFEGKVISGRSWLLAAHLQMEMLDRKDVFSARNLVNHFIVTGDVVDGIISSVDMGKKVDLATFKEYQSYRWILPLKNRKENKTMKAEYPKTLEDAYELIRTMRNRTTMALIDVAHAGNKTKDAIVNLLKNDADPSQTCSAIGQNARQIFAGAVSAEVGDCVKKIRGKLKEYRIEDLGVENAIYDIIMQFDGFMDRDRVMSYYGDVPQIFFMLAKAGRQDVISTLAEIYDINATDSTGETALDFAEEFKEPAVASILIQAGATRRGVYELKCDKMRNAIWNLNSSYDKDKANATRYVKEAIENGCSPNEIVDIHVDGNDFVEDEWFDCSPQYSNENEADEDDQYSPLFDPHAAHDYKVFVYKRRRYSTTLFWQAVCAENEELMETCMSHGGDVDVSITAATVQRLVKETFARTGKETIEHKYVFPDDDFIKGGLSLRDLIHDKWAVKKLSRKTLKMLADYAKPHC